MLPLWLVAAAGGSAPAAALVPEDLPTPSERSDASSPADGGDPASAELPWIRRWAPTPHTVELGAFGGVYLPSPDHELYDPSVMPSPEAVADLSRANGAVGGRIGYAPSRFFGVELEGGAMPTRTLDERRATLWTIKGNLVGQVGLWSVVPFALVGAGGLGVDSDALGRDVDATVHFGGGLKVNATRRVQVRLDLRDVLAARRGVADGVAHNGELLLGAAVRLGPQPEPRPAPRDEGPGDRDADGFLDPQDACPDRAGVEPDGCPVRDTDADGWLDPDDACPDVAGVDPDGCPPVDSDRDGFLDADDACPQQPGVEPDGCPLRDRDEDGWLDPDDACPDEPEVRNGFQDTDGCPDTLPEEVARFQGVIEGIYFDVDRATIRSRSRPVLDRAVSVLRRYPDLRLEISGHTDATGSYMHNVTLSQDRADAVRAYMVARGIDEARLVTRGAGPDEPIADNATRQGRQENRRIEFQVVVEEAR